MAIEATLTILWWEQPQDNIPRGTMRAINQSDFYFVNRKGKGIACTKDTWELFRNDDDLRSFINMDDALVHIKATIENKISTFAGDNLYREALEAGKLNYDVITLEHALRQQ